MYTTYYISHLCLISTIIISACDCDPSGSFGGGECETVTDPGRTSASGEVGTVAGRCICKRNVGGRRCDTCKDGFWNLLESNPDGCQCMYLCVTAFCASTIYRVLLPCCVSTFYRVSCVTALLCLYILSCLVVLLHFIVSHIIFFFSNLSCGLTVVKHGTIPLIP